MQDFSPEFINKIQTLLGDDSPSFFASLDNPIQKAITINYNRLNNRDFNEFVDFSISPIPEISNGYYVNEEIKIGKHILHHLGIIYSQEPSAMYPVEMLDIKEGDIVLDLCAAPGGKSIQILEKLNKTGLLISNEIVYNRAKILYENINRMGFNNTVITCNSPSDYEKTSLKFDKILVDAPCGGEGMFRRKDFDHQAYNNASIDTNARRQLSILNSVKDLLKVGGRLVYSTCTYDIRENEMVVVDFLKNNPEYRLIPYPRLDSVTSEGVKIANYNTQFCRRRYPHQFMGEGQFMAVLEKISQSDTIEDNFKTNSFHANGFTNLYKKEIELLNKELQDVANIKNLNLVKKNDNIFILPPTTFDMEDLNVLSVGTLLGTITKGLFKPAHTSFHSYSDIYYNSININKQQLSDYLQGLEIDVQSTIKGICVVKYENIALGGGKIVNRRLKNYYPKELRN